MLSTIAALLCVATFSQSVSARKCARHKDCPKFLPFCYDGTCELCSECEHCWDGVDGTCGGCDKRRFPTDGVKCPPPPKRDEYEEEEEEEADFLDEEEEEEAGYLDEEEEEYEAEYLAMEEEETEEENDYRPTPKGPRPKGPKMSRKEIMDAVRKQLDEDGVTETEEELETNVDMIVAIQDGEDLDLDLEEEEEDFPVDDEEEEDYDTDTETAYGQSCETHSDCSDLLPFCYETGDCAPCEECEYLSNGIDGTCGECGDGYPTMEDGDEYDEEEEEDFPLDDDEEEQYMEEMEEDYDAEEDDEYDGTCESHGDCGGDEPFCYAGECAPCSECHYCHDGVDNTCGSCGVGFPTREEDGVRCRDPRLFTKKRKRKYRKMIQDQLEEEGDTETEEEIPIVSRLAKENVKKGKFTDGLADTFDVDIDNDIEMKVIDAIRKAAKNENKSGLTERDIGNKLIEGLKQLAGNLLDDEEEEFDPAIDEAEAAEREYDDRRRASKSDKEIEAQVIRELKAEDDKRKRRKKQEDRE